MYRRFFIKLAIFILVLPLVLELSVRIFAPQQLIRFDNVYVADEGLGRVPAPDKNMIINTGERDVHYITNTKGFRVGATERKDPSLRILAIGDSFTVAMQVEYEQSFVGLLETSLSKDLNQTVQIDNAGSANFDVNGYHLRMVGELSREHYDMVLIFIYLGNDVTRKVVNSYPAWHPNPPPTLRWPRNFSKTELQDAIFYPINDILETSSHLFVLFKDRASVLLARVGLTAQYFPDDLLRTTRNDKRWEVTGQILKMMSDKARQQNIPIVFILLPSPYQVDTNYLDWARQAFGIKQDDIDTDQPSYLLEKVTQPYYLDMIDLQLPMRNAYAEGNILFGHVDSHLSPEGHQLVATTIEPHIVALLSSHSK